MRLYGGVIEFSKGVFMAMNSLNYQEIYCRKNRPTVARALNSAVFSGDRLR
jgi:hypothetical protein